MPRGVDASSPKGGRLWMRCLDADMKRLLLAHRLFPHITVRQTNGIDILSHSIHGANQVIESA